MTNQKAVVTQTDLSGIYTKISAGKVRDLYQIDEHTLLVVSTDRVSAFDVIMNNVSHSYGRLENRQLIFTNRESLTKDVF